MHLEIVGPFTYRPGALSAYTFMRAGNGWDFHQGPLLTEYADGRLEACWGAYDLMECNNDGVILYASSDDFGTTWTAPQIWMASPNAVASHVQISQRPDSGDCFMVYREGHYRGAVTDSRSRTTRKWADYASSRMYLLLRRSADCGRTWTPPVEIDVGTAFGIDPARYYGAPEQVLRLSNGDILLFVCYMDQTVATDAPYLIGCLRSRDLGATWQHSGTFSVPERRGAMEPSVVELAPGVLVGVLRNTSGQLYEVRSTDYGATWETPRQTDLPCVEAISKICTLASGRVLLVWNNRSSTTGLPRHPLAAAVSDDGCRTWGSPRILADELGTNQLSNFTVEQLSDGRILVCTSHYRSQPPPCSDLDMIIFDEQWLDESS